MKERFNLYKHIMNGLSYTLPLVVAGGLLIAMTTYGLLSDRFPYLHDTGLQLLEYTYPILACYIAYSIADRPGIAPGIIAGALAYTGESYFLGAILGGFAAGYTIEIIKWLFSKWPKSMTSLKPMLIFPLLGVLLTSIIMLGINFVMSPFSLWLIEAMTNLSGIALIITCLILGALMAFDLGGPINKIAFLIGLISVVHVHDSIMMAAVMVAGMTPPLAIALSLMIFQCDFSELEIKQRKQTLLMGLSFISEGAVPFVKTYKKVIHIPMIIGSMFGAFMVAMLQTTLPAPHGGIFILLWTPSWQTFLLALASGAALSTLLIKFSMMIVKRKPSPAPTQS